MHIQLCLFYFTSIYQEQLCDFFYIMHTTLLGGKISVGQKAYLNLLFSVHESLAGDVDYFNTVGVGRSAIFAFNSTDKCILHLKFPSGELQIYRQSSVLSHLLELCVLLLWPRGLNQCRCLGLCSFIEVPFNLWMLIKLKQDEYSFEGVEAYQPKAV